MSNAETNVVPETGAFYTSTDYTVTIGVSPFVGISEGKTEVPPAYLITNNVTGIVEGEHRVIGMAIRMAKEMQAIYDDEKASAANSKEAAVDAVPDLEPHEPGKSGV